MKKFLSLLFVILLVLSLGFTSNVFADTRQSPFMSKTYNHDSKFDGYTVSNGLDISAYQTKADFKKAKANGVEFVILRAAYRGYGKSGNMVKDKYFDIYATAAIDAGLDIGAYIYSQAITVKEAEAEADYILSIVKDYNITLPIVFDYEYAWYDDGRPGRLRAAKLTNKQRTNICIAFCKRVEAAGYTAMVYANQSMLTNDLNDDVIAKDYDIWLANYSIKPIYNKKLYDQPYTYWQYTSTGKVNGIPGNIDCNFRYFKAPDKVNDLSLVSETIDEIKIKWSKVKGCYGYQIYKFTDNGKFEYYKTIKGAGITEFSDTEAEGMPSRYIVRAISAYKGSFVSGEFSDELATEGAFSLHINSTTSTSTTISWNAYKNASEYEVYRLDLDAGNYILMAKTDSQTTTFTDDKQPAFKTCFYQVTAIIKDEDGNIVETKNTPIKTITKNQPILNQVALKTNKKIEIKWTNVSDASGTQIFRKAKNGNFKKIATINNADTCYYIDKNIKKGTEYTYRVRHFLTTAEKTEYSDYTTEKSATPMKTVSIKTSNYRKRVKITYEKVAGATGYEIYMKAQGGKYKRVKTTKKAIFVKKSLKPNKKYYFKVRAYKKVNGKRVYASFSKSKSAKPF